MQVEMQIHNFLCDLLASVRLLIDDYIFPHNPGLIKSYEFNLGNRTFQIGLEPTSTYELPAAIVNIQDENINFGGRRSDLIQQNSLDNVNKIPVLQNATNKVVVHIHEEHVIVPISISINCESQLQAKELAYQIKKTLPLNKNLNTIQFTSFLEIDQNILFNILNYNILLDQIDNLYTKVNHNTGNIEYCFSLTHNPLIRLDSVSASISDTSQTTFQTQMDIAYIIPFPMYLVIEEYKYFENINFSFNFSNMPIVTFPLTHLSTNENPDQKIDRTLIIDTEDNSYPSGLIINKTETQVFISIQFFKEDFIIDNTKYKYRFSKNINYLKQMQDLVPTFYYEADNKIVFVLTLDQYEIFKPSTTHPLFIDFYYDLED
jgi:hypothetical protein